MTAIRDLAVRAKSAARALAQQPSTERTLLLGNVAAALGRPEVRAAVARANAADVADARAAVEAGELSEALAKRLLLPQAKLDALADGLRQLAVMPEVVGRVRERRLLDHGLLLKREDVPLGLLAVVFESRPDALVQIAGLALKSGNAVMLKGGKEAMRTNAVLADVLQVELSSAGIDPAAVTLLTTRTEVAEMLALDDLVELVVARGSGTFVNHIKNNSRIPVMGHAAGLCHLFIDAAADPTMSARLAVDSKCDYPAACNAVETLLWHRDAVGAAQQAVAALREAGVSLRGCPASIAALGPMDAARALDWDTEYNDLVLSVARVDDLAGALAHIARHGSKHTEVIVTADAAAAARFLAEVDAAGVFHNASSRFADGYRYGLGAEVGISTEKLHARGPVGLDGLLTTRWVLRGAGHVASDYGPGKKAFLHTALDHRGDVG